MKKYKLCIQVVSVLLLLISLGGCSVKKITYFNDLQADSTYVLRKAAAYAEPKVQVDDILQVAIQTIDPTTSAVVNQAIQTPALGSNSTQTISGFLVDKEGAIHLNLIGKVSVLGMTSQEVRAKITDLATQYYNNPTVQVRFANFKVTILGEVMKPASYIIPNEKVSILEALGMAGDLTIYGRRENVLLIRESGQQKEMIRLNLNDSHLVESPYFYLRQNDVLYVEPGKGKAAANNAARTQTYVLIGSVISLMLVVISRFN